METGSESERERERESGEVQSPGVGPGILGGGGGPRLGRPEPSEALRSFRLQRVKQATTSELSW